MNQVLETILSIVLFIVSLGLLIIIHELGHFSMAKLFNVYCQEFSVGFGPALLHKRKQGKETYFSIRAIPLGGYVSMYGEDVQLEDGVSIPKERSLEGIHRGKKAIIVSAGVILNAVLALLLFAISNICFPVNSATTWAHVNESSSLYEAGLRDDDKLSFYGPSDNKLVTLSYDNDGTTYQAQFYIVDDNASIGENKYIVAYAPSGNKNETVFSDAFSLFPVDTSGTVKDSDFFKDWSSKGVDLVNYPDIKQGTYNLLSEVSLSTTLNFYKYTGTDSNGNRCYSDLLESFPITIKSSLKDPNSSSYVWEDIGLSFKTTSYWLSFGDRVKNTFDDFGTASVAIIKGIGSLFTGGIKNMSGIVSIFTTSSQVLSQYTFATYLYFWGLISVNLAIFNLLPFPGLDGWALLVTAIEGSVNLFGRISYKKKNNGSLENYQDWKIPSKLKNIVSFIGLALLFLLMIAIVVLDVLRLVGLM